MLLWRAKASMRDKVAVHVMVPDQEAMPIAASKNTSEPDSGVETSGSAGDVPKELSTGTEEDEPVAVKMKKSHDVDEFFERVKKRDGVVHWLCILCR